MKKLTIAVLSALAVTTAALPCSARDWRDYRDERRAIQERYDEIRREREEKEEEIRDRYYQNSPHMDRAQERRACGSISGNDAARADCYNSLD